MPPDVEADGYRDLQWQEAGRGEVEDQEEGRDRRQREHHRQRQTEPYGAGRAERRGRRLLAKRGVSKANLGVSRAFSSASSRVILDQTLTFKAVKHH
jgi:hypothetical protein